MINRSVCLLNVPKARLCLRNLNRRLAFIQNVPSVFFKARCLLEGTKAVTRNSLAVIAPIFTVLHFKVLHALIGPPSCEQALSWQRTLF